MPKPIDIPGASPELIQQLQACEPAVQDFILALHKENKKLHTKMATLEAANASLNNRAETLAEHKDTPKLTNEELIESLIPTVAEIVRDAGGWQAFCDLHKLNPDTVLFETDE